MPASSTATHASALTSPTSSLDGLGLFSAKPASLRFLPAPALRLRASNNAPAAAIHPALVSADTAWSALPPGLPIRNTTLALPAPGTPTRYAATVEHALSACAGLHLWGVTLALDGGPELPILDGSALPFVHALRPHLAPAPAAVSPITLSEPLEVRAGDAFIRAEPCDSIDYTYSLDYGPASPLPPQRAAWRGDPDDYAANIAPARTFSLRAEAHAARAAGLFTHLSPRDMLVIADNGSPIDNAWRLPHEPARHKLLDLIGDLALLGRPLHARVLAHRAGHALTHRLCALVLAKSRAE